METGTTRYFPHGGSDFPEPGIRAEPTWIDDMIELVDERLEEWRCDWPSKDAA
jgi:hypothetical protein